MRRLVILSQTFRVFLWEAGAHVGKGEGGAVTRSSRRQGSRAAELLAERLKAWREYAKLPLKHVTQIVSVSRRTDIPAFYAEWFMNRVRAGFCTVPNPRNPTQVARVSLTPEDVAVLVFWTRAPGSMLPYLAELSERGYRYYFLYTLMDNPRTLDPRCPRPEAAVATFRRLADLIGPRRVVWRYDPIVFSNVTPADFHASAFERLASALRGYTVRSIVSLVDEYRRNAARLRTLAELGVTVRSPGPEEAKDLMERLAVLAKASGMDIVSCAEKPGWAAQGVASGACIDAAYVEEEFDVHVPGRKDPAQRGACRCVASRDIGVYDTCLFDCAYCYATSSPARAHENHRRHDSDSQALLS